MKNPEDCTIMIEMLKLTRTEYIPNPDNVIEHTRVAQLPLLTKEQQDKIIDKLFKNLKL